MNINGAIVADRVYVSKVLVAKDVEITLPEVTPTTADVDAMGTMAMPIWQRLDDMQTTISKIGIDLGLRSMLKADPIDLEIRWSQDDIDANGNVKPVGCKAFVKGIPAGIPGISIVPGEPSANEVPVMTTRYQLYSNGTEMFLVDRLASICRIAGKDYMKDHNALL